MKEKSNSSFKEYFLPEEMRSELKDPLGELITKEPTLKLIKLVEEEKPPIVIFVGRQESS